MVLRINPGDWSFYFDLSFSGIECKKEERRLHVRSIINSLKNEDIDCLLIALKEKGGQENPLLLAAESGSYKILKSIVEIGPEILDREDFSFADCNEEGENVLHMCKLPEDCRYLIFITLTFLYVC